MPWVSKAQARWGHSQVGRDALGGAQKVAEWDSATKKALPERKGKTKTQSAIAKLSRGMLGKKK